MHLVVRWLAVLCLVTATTASAAERVRVVVLGFDGSTDALRRVGTSVAEQVLTELGRFEQLEAMGASDVQALLGMERQKAMLGCAEASSSCLSEMSAAMGAPWLITGSLAQFGKATRLDLKLIRARDGKAVFRDGVNFKEESDLFNLVSGIVKRAVTKMDLKAQADAPRVTTSSPPPEPPPNPSDVVNRPAEPITPPFPVVVQGATASSGRGPAWAVTGVGAALMLGGAAAFAVGFAQASDLRARLGAEPGTSGQAAAQPVPDYATAKASMGRSLTLEASGAIAAAAGVLVAGTGLTWALMKRPDDAPAVTLEMGPSSLVVRGSF